MSKSLGNFYTVHELLEEFPGEALRLVLLKSQYRQPLDFSKDKLRNAKAELDKFYRLIGNHRPTELSEVDVDQSVLFALQDDLNAPMAISQLHSLYEEATKANFPPQIVAKLIKSARLLGILQQDPETWFKGESNDDEAAEIEVLIQKRKDAKANRDFGLSDAIRDQLAARGIVLEDKPGGVTEWRKA